MWKLTAELNHCKTPNLPSSIIYINLTFIQKIQIYLYHRPPKIERKYKKRKKKKEKLLKVSEGVVNELQKGRKCGEESLIVPPFFKKTFHIYSSALFWSILISISLKMDSKLW